MKTILLPTDFSEVSINASKYAISLFKQPDTRFILFHSFDPSAKENYANGDAFNSFEEVKEKLNDLCEELRSSLTYQSLTIKSNIVKGLAKRHILEQASRWGADCIVMGTTGASGIKKRIIGSVASNILKRSKRPVIVVPKNIGVAKINSVLLASDYKHIDNQRTLEFLKEIVECHNASVKVLNIRKRNKATKLEETMAAMDMERFLDDVPHKYEFVENNIVEKGLKDYLKTKHADLLCMVLHVDNINLLIPTSTVEKAAMELSIPLLCLPEITSN